MRRRSWLVTGVVALVAVVTAGILVLAGGRDLDRVATVDLAGRVDEPDTLTVDVTFDDSGDTAYLAYATHQRYRVAAVRAGADEPAWTTTPFEGDSSIRLATAGGVLLALGSPGVVALDPATGRTLWTAAGLSVPEVIGHADGYVAVHTSADRVYTGAAGLDLRTGLVVWRFGTGRDRFALVPGTTRLAHYSATGSLRLVDITNGRTRVEIDAPPYRGDATELDTTEDTAVLRIEQDGGTRSTVYSATDLAELWSDENGVYPLSADRFYVGDGQVVDPRNRPVWRSGERVRGFVGDTGWGYTQSVPERPTDAYLTRYLELDTGRQGAEDRNTPVRGAHDGVLQADSFGGPGIGPGAGRGLELWFVELPSGDRTDLGRIEVFRETCAFSDTHVACLDTDRRFGVWSHT